MEEMVKNLIENLECLGEQMGLSEEEELYLTNLEEILFNLRNEGHP